LHLLLGGDLADKVSTATILRKRISITGSTLRPRPIVFKGAIASSLYQHVWPLLENGTIKPIVYKTFPLAEASQAHALMESNEHIGKIILTL
jgi:NADPH2:quinone reductase